VINSLDNILKGLPALGVYIDLLGESRMRLLEEPLVDLYASLIKFGIQAAKLFDPSIDRKYLPPASREDGQTHDMNRESAWD
jgi:hypothetical protein